MRALLDVNALIALLDKNHVHHLPIATWFAQNAKAHGWASCPLTQNGAVRIIGNKGYGVHRQPPQATIGKLVSLCQNPLHQFWPDDASLLDPVAFDHQIVLTSDQLTDVYLLGLAVKNGGKLVTLDKGIPANAVAGFQPGNIEVVPVPKTSVR